LTKSRISVIYAAFLLFLLSWCVAMISFHVPALVRQIADRYKDLAREGSIPYPLLCAYIAMPVYGMSSLSDLVRHCPWVPSLSVLSAHISRFDDRMLAHVQRRLTWSVLKRVRRNPQKWVFVIDTTKNPKRIKELTGRGLWGDSNNVIFEGQNLLVIAAVNLDSGESIPVAWEPCLKPSERKEAGSASTQTLLLLENLVSQGWPKLTVICDSWFDGFDFMKKLDERDFEFVIQLKPNRKPKLVPAPRARKHHLRDIFAGLPRSGVRASTRGPVPKMPGMKGMKFYVDKSVWIQGGKGNRIQLPLKVTAVYNHPRESRAFGYYATNALSKSGAWLWKMSRVRWNIEVMFRDLKHHMAWGKLASGFEQGNNLSLFTPIAVLAYLRENQLQSCSIGKQISTVRHEELLRSLHFITTKPKNAKVVRLISRLDPSRSCCKPVDTAAEKRHFTNKSKKAA
jgi:hypothetical protein